MQRLVFSSPQSLTLQPHLSYSNHHINNTPPMHSTTAILLTLCNFNVRMVYLQQSISNRLCSRPLQTLQKQAFCLGRPHMRLLPQLQVSHPWQRVSTRVLRGLGIQPLVHEIATCFILATLNYLSRIRPRRRTSRSVHWEQRSQLLEIASRPQQLEGLRQRTNSSIPATPHLLRDLRQTHQPPQLHRAPRRNERHLEDQFFRKASLSVICCATQSTTLPMS